METCFKRNKDNIVVLLNSCIAIQLFDRIRRIRLPPRCVMFLKETPYFRIDQFSWQLVPVEQLLTFHLIRLFCVYMCERARARRTRISNKLFIRNIDEVVFLCRTNVTGVVLRYDAKAQIIKERRICCSSILISLFKISDGSVPSESRMSFAIALHMRARKRVKFMCTS